MKRGPATPPQVGHLPRWRPMNRRAQGSHPMDTEIGRIAPP